MNCEMCGTKTTESMGSDVPVETVGKYFTYVERRETSIGLRRDRYEFCSIECLEEYVQEE